MMPTTDPQSPATPAANQAADEGCAAMPSSDSFETLPLPCEMSDEMRYATQADGTPALRVCVILGQEDARLLNDWFTSRCKIIKANKWKDWNRGDMAIRTLCAQIDSFSRRAFRSHNAKGMP